MSILEYDPIMILLIRIYLQIYDIYSKYIVKGSLGGETSVLRIFRMSGKELVKETVSQRNS